MTSFDSTPAATRQPTNESTLGLVVFPQPFVDIAVNVLESSRAGGLPNRGPCKPPCNRLPKACPRPWRPQLRSTALQALSSSQSPSYRAPSGQICTPLPCLALPRHSLFQLSRFKAKTSKPGHKRKHKIHLQGGACRFLSTRRCTWHHSQMYENPDERIKPHLFTSLHCNSKDHEAPRPCSLEFLKTTILPMLSIKQRGPSLPKASWRIGVLREST